MSVILQSSGGGQITLQEPTTASNFTQTLPAATGTVVISGTTPSLNGITFPATQSASADANTLDDYEEGTYTPIVASGITSPTYSSQLGRYTKIGRFCYFQFIITVTGGTRNTSVVSISLPFTANSTGNFAGGGFFNYVNGSVINSTTTNLPVIYIGGANATLDLYKTDGGSFIGTDLNSTNPQIYLSGCYEV